jgi:hypothetical protein
MRESVLSAGGSSWRRVLLGVAAAALLATPVLVTEATAQPAIGHAAAATLRTVAEMEAFDAAYPDTPVANSPTLPTMDFEQYLLLKSTAGPVEGAFKLEPANTGQGAPPAVGPLHCNGIGQNAPIAGGGFPPDTHAAIGANHLGQVVNSAIRFSTKALTANCPTNATVINVTLAAFFGYSAQGLFDPRILYDLNYGRWIVSAEAFPESATVQHQFIAVSVDSDPTLGFFFYDFNMAGIVGNNIFWDYPQIGYDEGAVILTGNTFNGPAYAGSQVIFFDKHRMYRGGAFSFCFNGPFFDNVGTITPPIVLDQSPYTVVSTARPGANLIRLRKYTGTTQVCPTFLSSNDIAISTTVPPLAQQPGITNCTIPTNCLDTLDGRFQSQGTQFGEPVFGTPVRTWQVRTNGQGGFPVPHAYKINADTNTIEEDCTFFLSGSSFDFNPAIVTNFAGTTFIAWSATDPPNGINAQVRITGKKSTDLCGTLGSGILVNQSANPLTGNFDGNKGFERWGDTSAVTLDPADFTKVWGMNEKVQSSANPTTWKSYIFNMTNP